MTLRGRDVTVSDLDRLEGDRSALGGVFAMGEEEFRALYEHTARPIWAYLVRMTGDASAADDLLQETYYRFLRTGAAPDDEGHRRRYLFTIATNLVRDAHRRRRVRPEVAVDEGPEIADPGGEVTRRECQADVRTAIRRLKPRDREALWLAYAEGASHREIGDVLGLRQSSVKPLLFRARRRLADVLRRAGYTGGGPHGSR
jgi:RNA polymerase sigma-70 factor, ECF subfamily